MGACDQHGIRDRSAGRPGSTTIRTIRDGRNTLPGSRLAPCKSLRRRRRRNTRLGMCVDRLCSIEAALTASLAAALYIDARSIDPAKPFVDLGLDSIDGVEWVQCDQQGIRPCACRRHASMIIPASRRWRGAFSRFCRAARRTTSLRAAGACPGARAGSDAARRRTHRRDRHCGPLPGGRRSSPVLDQSFAGQDSVREIPASRWNVDDWFDPDPTVPGKTYCKWLGALDGVENFDPLFFGISPAEAETMVPSTVCSSKKATGVRGRRLWSAPAEPRQLRGLHGHHEL